VVAAALCAAGLLLAGCSGDDSDADAAQCEQLSERDRSTLVAVIAQADAFGVASNEFLDSAVADDVQREAWLADSRDRLAVMRSATAEQQRLVESLESDALQELLRPGLVAYRRAVTDLSSFRRGVERADAEAIRAAADRIDTSQQSDRRQSEAFTRRLLRDFCNPPPLPERPT
jgi:hypothetical protein